jgi:hypothetical protein
MKLAVGGDHAGFPLKGPVIEKLNRGARGDGSRYAQHRACGFSLILPARSASRYATVRRTGAFSSAAPGWARPSPATNIRASAPQSATITTRPTSVWNTTTSTCSAWARRSWGTASSMRSSTPFSRQSSAPSPNSAAGCRSCTTWNGGQRNRSSTLRNAAKE